MSYNNLVSTPNVTYRLHTQDCNGAIQVHNTTCKGDRGIWPAQGQHHKGLLSVLELLGSGWVSHLQKKRT